MKDKDISKVSNGEYILVKGDISGIQEFIFNVKSKKAAQSLKGRSFFIKVLTEISIQFLFDLFSVFDDTEKHDFRISTSGGNFFLKLPYIQDAESKIKNAQLLLSKGLRFSGINVSLNYVKLDKVNYSNCLIELNQKVRINKLSLYTGIDHVSFNDLFSPTDKSNYTTIDDNNNWIPITSKIRLSKYFSINKSGQNELKLNGNSIELIGYKCLFHDLETEPNKTLLSNYLENLFPIHREGNRQGNTKEFEDLVKIRGGGVEKLGILKMDVDNLGTTLEKIHNIEYHKEFDKELNLFFNSELRTIITTNTSFNDNIYTVTSGGDDSFFVGNWKLILELSIAINKSFSKYPYFKAKDLTISAGYIIVNPKFPVVRFSQLAEEAIHKAKYDFTKGNICIFDEVVSWEMLDEIQLFKIQLSKGVDGKSKGLLAKARQTAIKGIDDDVVTLKENWEIAYYLRNYSDKAIVNKISDNIEISTKINGITPFEKLKKRDLRLILPIAARLTELEKR